jgi:hypothetical protein
MEAVSVEASAFQKKSEDVDTGYRQVTAITKGWFGQHQG